MAKTKKTSSTKEKRGKAASKKRKEKAVKPILPSVRLYRRIAGVFLSLTVALLIVVLYLATVQATVLVETQEEPLVREFTARVMVEPQGAEDIPGSFFTEVKELTRTVEVSGEGEELPAKATGTIIVKNDSSRAQPLIATTRFLNQDGVLFRLTEGVTAPANGEVVATVAADVEGLEGEIGPSSFTIPGLIEARQQEVYGVSNAPMVGGTVRRSILTQEELDITIDAMLEEAQGQVDKAWREQISGQLDGAEIFSYVTARGSDATVGEETSVYTATATVEFTGIYYDRSRLAQIAELMLNDYLPEGRVLSSVENDQLVVTYSRHDLAQGTAHFDVTVNGAALLERTAEILNKDNLIGLTAQEAEAFLEAQDTIKDAQVLLEPFWVKRVPRLRDHISIDVVE